MMVLITGASGGLGSAVVEAFLATATNRVYGVARSWHNPPSSGQFQGIEADLSQPAECERAVAEAGAVDALIHLVGGFSGGNPVAQTSQNEWQSLLDLNLGVAFSMFRAVLPGMLERKHGRIVAVASRAALEPMPNYAAYSVSKAALVALVKTVALEVKDAGVTSNAVLPGTIETPANRAAMPKADRSKWVSPQSIADLLVWLASPQAGNVNGAAVPIYGRS